MGFWRPQERNFLDVRIFDPNCKTYIEKDPQDVYKSHENAKKNDYCDRVLQVERGSLTPLIFSTTGGEGKEAQRFHQHLAALIAEKEGEKYGIVRSFIRRRIRFSLLRTLLESLRGARNLSRNYLDRAWRVVDVDMDLIDIRNSDKINYKE